MKRPWLTGMLLALSVMQLHAEGAAIALTVSLNARNWTPKTLTAGVETVMNMTVLDVLAQVDKERLDISVDYHAITGKTSAAFTFAPNMMAPPGGASISYAPNGLGKQQWVSSTGNLVVTEFDEANKTLTGTFECTLMQLLDDKGGLVMTTPRPTMSLSGKISKLGFRKVN